MYMDFNMQYYLDKIIIYLKLILPIDEFYKNLIFLLFCPVVKRLLKKSFVYLSAYLSALRV